MAEIKWVKLNIDMFDNRKIKHLRRLPDGNNIVLIWVMLLTMAGRCNAGGMIFLTENIPYTPKMLADELGIEENTVTLALKALENLNMIVTDNGYFAIAGWEEYQNTDRLAELKEYNRIAKQKSRAKKKALLESANDVNDMSMTSQCGQGTDIDKDKDRDKEKEDKNDKTDSFDIRCVPHPLVKELILCGYISYDDLYLDLYNSVADDLVNTYSFEVARSCVWYFCKRYKEKQTDENGNAIENKLAYFRTSVNDGANRLERDNNREHCGVGSWLYN